MNTKYLHELIRKRRSTVSFSNQPIEEDKLGSLFEAARWAPSSMNLQPWRFIYAMQENSYEFERMLKLLNPPNQEWAKNAPVLALVVARMYHQSVDKTNSFALHDVGLATGIFILQAVSLGLHVHPMGGYNVENAKKELHIPTGHEPAAMLAIGYPGDPGLLPSHLKEKETRLRTRMPLGEIVFRGKWKENP